ncbi:MAG: patatin-like phospholipase family protein [Anaerolineales bacterium]
MEFDLVFEGGGAKGMVFVGAMDVFYQRGHTHNRLMGTSAGAITAALTAAGYTTNEMLTALAEKGDDGKPVFASFMSPPGPLPDEVIAQGAFAQLLKNFDIPYVPDFLEQIMAQVVLQFFASKLPARHLLSLVELGGWFSADNFVTWLRHKLDTGTFNGQPRNFSAMTLSQFYAATGKDLTLIAADTTGEMMLVLNHRTAPDCPLVWAVRMSMSIPLLWQEVVWKPEWGFYRGANISGHTIVDGGLLSNFPIELFISSAPQVTALMGPKPHDNVLGLLIDEDLPVPGAENTTTQSPGGIKLSKLRTVRRLNALINTTLSARDKSVIAAFEHLVVRLPAKDYGTVEFDMSDERRELLVNAGRQVMKTYLNQRDGRTLLPGSAAPQTPPPPTPNEIADTIAQRMLGEVK